MEHRTALQDHRTGLLRVELLGQPAGNQQEAVHVGDHRAVGEDGGLGVARGARRKDDHCGVVLVATGGDRR